MYPLEEFDEAKTKVLKYILYKKSGLLQPYFIRDIMQP